MGESYTHPKLFAATEMTSPKTETYHSCWENVSQGLKIRKKERKKNVERLAYFP